MKVVVGRIVDLAGGRPTIQALPSRWTGRVATLVAAAREYRAKPSPETLATLKQAAMRIE